MIKPDSTILQKILNTGRKIIPRPIFEFFQPWYHKFLAFGGAVLYGFPGRKLKIVGITGTNGKTSVVHLATHVFRQSGYTVASLSSLRFSIADKEWKNKLKMTMPGRLKMQRFMRETVNAGCSHLIMEVTSEGIRQNRHKAISFDTTVFTNLTPEHIESHGSFENYKKAKGKLFALPHRVSVVNVDDEHAEYFMNFEAEKKVGYGLQNSQYPISNVPASPAGRQYLKAESIQQEQDVTRFNVNNIEFKTKLSGKFNVYNSLAAISVAQAQGISLQKSSVALETFPGIPGRMEKVIGEPFSVVVDYAHTPDALENVYKTVSTNYKLQTTNSKMVCVLGSAGGGRDKWKRSQLGEIADGYCDEIVITNEDPYGEDPQKIIADVAKGVKEKEAEKIADRREAIRYALKKARNGDIVVITGKGAEPLLMTKEGGIEWDDRQVAREEFSKLHLE